MGLSIVAELGAVEREMLEQERRKITILTEGEQVHLMQRVDMVLRIIVQDAVRYEQRTTLIG